MICDHLSSLLGMHCLPLDEAGTVALVETPFRFDDGDAVQIFVQATGNEVRFFDDGATAWHMVGRGLDVSDGRKHGRVLQGIADFHGLCLNERLCLEAKGEIDLAPQHFARFVAAMLAMAAWEREHRDADVDAALLLDEVAVLLARASPELPLQRGVVMEGVSKQQHKVDFVLGNAVILAVRPESRSVSAAIRRLIDVKNAPTNAELEYRVVVDDRLDPAAAQREGSILSAVASVTNFRSLERATQRTGVH
jgi:hypothetical protein